jgi:hypothetical protein
VKYVSLGVMDDLTVRSSTFMDLNETLLVFAGFNVRCIRGIVEEQRAAPH